MKTCRTCFFCVPKYDSKAVRFYRGTCYQAQRQVQAEMTACQLYQERGGKVAVKSNPKKRNKYRDVKDNVMLGMTIAEVLDKPLTILAKREHKWGMYEGLAVKVRGPNDKLAVVEITANIPIQALNNPKLPKPPYKARFVQKTSKNKRKYYTIELLDVPEPDTEGENNGNGIPL